MPNCHGEKHSLFHQHTDQVTGKFPYSLFLCQVCLVCFVQKSSSHWNFGNTNEMPKGLLLVSCSLKGFYKAFQTAFQEACCSYYWYCDFSNSHVVGEKYSYALCFSFLSTRRQSNKSNHIPGRQIISIGHLSHPSAAATLQTVNRQKSIHNPNLPTKFESKIGIPKPNVTNVAHSSASPGPEAAWSPGLLCASSKFYTTTEWQN
jgi:hypothetical protein